MEILPSIRTQNSQIQLHPHCSIDSNRKSVSNGEAKSIYRSNFSQIKCRKLVLSSSSYNESASVTHPGFQSMPLSVDLEPVSSESQFDQVVAEAQQLEQPVVVLWFDFYFIFFVLGLMFNWLLCSAVVSEECSCVAKIWNFICLRPNLQISLFVYSNSCSFGS